jgi:hypothetical protein
MIGFMGIVPQTADTRCPPSCPPFPTFPRRKGQRFAGGGGEGTAGTIVGRYSPNTYNIDAVEVYFSSGAPCMTNGD